MVKVYKIFFHATPELVCKFFLKEAREKITYRLITEKFYNWDYFLKYNILMKCKHSIHCGKCSTNDGPMIEVKTMTFSEKETTVLLNPSDAWFQKRECFLKIQVSEFSREYEDCELSFYRAHLPKDEFNPYFVMSLEKEIKSNKDIDEVDKLFATFVDANPAKDCFNYFMTKSNNEKIGVKDDRLQMIYQTLAFPPVEIKV